jgi:hypothetical protein
MTMYVSLETANVKDIFLELYVRVQVVGEFLMFEQDCEKAIKYTSKYLYNLKVNSLPKYEQTTKMGLIYSSPQNISFCF